MPKLPFMQFYPGDWMKDTRCLSLEARGAWIDLICLLWESSTRGQVKWPMSAFDQFLGTVERGGLIYSATDILDELAMLNIADIVTDGNGIVTLTCRRMVREESQRNHTRDRVQRFRNAVSNGDVTEKKRRIYQKSEVRSHISEKKNKTPPSAAFVLPDWINAETWGSFEEMRKKERHPLTCKACDLIVRELGKLAAAGHDPNECLERSIANGWRGVFPPGIRNSKPQQEGQLSERTMKILRRGL